MRRFPNLLSVYLVFKLYIKNITDLGVFCVCILKLYWRNLSLITIFIEYLCILYVN